jgi:hypothetical protein
METLLIPSSIQRIRSFLVEMSGMRVKPWATTEETLSALHTTLLAKRQCPIFWTSLRALLTSLAGDLRARQEAEPGSALDNELLDGDRHQRLLDEIRAVLQSQSSGTSTFRRLASSISVPALALLLLLGGAATVGCDRSSLHGANSTEDGGAPDTSTGGSAATDAKDPTKASDSASLVIILPDVAPARDLPPDTFAPTSADGNTVTIQDIMDSCNVPEAERGSVLSCLAAMRASWTTGTASALAGQNCNTVQRDLDCFLQSQVSCSPSAGDFDPSALDCPKIVPIYYGVRFV